MIGQSTHCFWSAAILLAIVTGCAQAPHVEILPPPLQSGAIIDQPSDLPVDASAVAWWHPLADNDLNMLIGRALAGNPTTKIAEERLKQAEVQVRIARSSRWPAIQTRGARSVMNFSDDTRDTRSDLGALALSWDPGLWGKRRLQIDAAKQFRDQRWFELQQTALTISTQVAETYYLIIEGRSQHRLLAAQIRVSKELEKLIEARFRLGQAAASELYQQREQSASLRQLQLLNDANTEALERRLDALLGVAPDQQPRVTQHTLPQSPMAATLRSPQALIQTRADVRAGYAILQQAAAEVGLRFVERLPSLQVTLGASSLTEKALSTQWLGHGLDLTAPLFAGGKLRFRQTEAVIELEAQRQRYHAIWLNALEEISTVDWRLQQQTQLIATARERRNYAQKALNAAKNRYVLGDQNFLDVLIALRGLQDIDRLLNTQRREMLLLWVRLNEAIGAPICEAYSDCQDRWAS